MKKYSVLTFNIGGYEKIHQIPKECINDEIEYVYVTDDHSITSDTWTVVYADDLTGSTFDKVFQIRYNPFKYVTTDVVMKIDGSMAINKDVMPLFKAFDDGGYDVCMLLHPTRATMIEEYKAWVYARNYPAEQANRSLSFMAQNGYDVQNYKALYQFNFMIQRNNDIVNHLNAETYNVLKANAPSGETIDRLDQTIGTFVMETHYPNLKVMPVLQYICFDSYFRWCAHNTDVQMQYNCANDITPYMHNKTVTVYYI